jgi:hypothetical protein
LVEVRGTVKSVAEQIVSNLDLVARSTDGIIVKSDPDSEMFYSSA